MKKYWNTTNLLETNLMNWIYKVNFKKNLNT